ncbi:MAG TPA: RDD family protein, partial [Acidimicrobiales bacterium]|nr:RDD family protein [Acidimicrobiales bacterium]
MYCPRCGSSIDGYPCPVCGAQGPAAADGAPDYAGWWRRLGATVFDNLILFVPESAAYLVGDAIGNAVLGAAFALVILGLYTVLMLSRPRGQTLGNRMVGTRVRDATTLQPIAVPQATVRWLYMALYLAPGYSATSTSATTRALGAIVFAAFVLDGLYPLVSR